MHYYNTDSIYMLLVHWFAIRKYKPKHCIIINCKYRSKLPLLFKIVKEAVDIKLGRDLENCPGVSFTTDLWSSRNQDPYLALTLHYIDPAWNLNRIMVYCGLAEGRHTSQFVAAHIDRFDSNINCWRQMFVLTIR